MRTRLLPLLAASLFLVACDNAQAPPAAGDVSRGQGTDGGSSAPSAESLLEPRAPAGPASIASDGAAASSAAAVDLHLGNGVLRHPDDLQMLMLAYRLKGAAPPVEAWAATVSGVRLADEFTRPRLLQAEIARQRAAYAATAGVGLVQVSISGSLSQYDATSGGFYVSSLQPGSTVYFNSFEDVELQFDNASAAHLWHMTPAAARTAFERNRSIRDISADVTARITGVETRGDHMLIRASVQRYAVQSYDSTIGQLGSQEIAR